MLSGNACANIGFESDGDWFESLERYEANCEYRSENNYRCHMSYVELVNIFGVVNDYQLFALLSEYLAARVSVDLSGASVFTGKDHRDFDLLCELRLELGGDGTRNLPDLARIQTYYFLSNSAFLGEADFRGGGHSYREFLAACARYQARFEAEL